MEKQAHIVNPPQPGSSSSPSILTYLRHEEFTVSLGVQDCSPITHSSFPPKSPDDLCYLPASGSAPAALPCPHRLSQDPAIPRLHSIRPQKLQGFARHLLNSLSAHRSSRPSEATAGMHLHPLVVLFQELLKVSGSASVHQLCFLDL